MAVSSRTTPPSTFYEKGARAGKTNVSGQRWVVNWGEFRSWNKLPGDVFQFEIGTDKRITCVGASGGCGPI